MMGTTQKARPNANHILSLMRDDDLGHDPWGTAISWAFGVAEVLHAAGEDVPDELGFRPSPYVSTDDNVCPDEYPDAFVWEHLHSVDPYLFPDAYDELVRELQFAGRCLHRYLDWCRAAGRDY